MMFIFLFQAYFTQCDKLKVHPCSANVITSFFFVVVIIPLYIYIYVPDLFYPFIC